MFIERTVSVYGTLLCHGNEPNHPNFTSTFYRNKLNYIKIQSNLDFVGMLYSNIIFGGV